MNWLRTTHDPFAGCWEEIVALVQVHPEWTASQIVQEIGHQMASHLVSSPMRTLIHRLNAIRASLRATWEEPWPTELIQRGTPEALSDASPTHDQIGNVMQDALCPAPLSISQPDESMEKRGASDPACSHAPEVSPPVPLGLVQAIEVYMQHLHERGRALQALEWHRTSLFALQQSLWEQCHLTEVDQLSREALHRWVTDLRTVRSPRTGEPFSMNTIAAYARSGWDVPFVTGWCSEGLWLSHLFRKTRCPKHSAVFLNPSNQRSL